MSAEVFLDANILLYASSAAAADAEKRERAQALMIEERFALSAQVLQEFIANALRKNPLASPSPTSTPRSNSRATCRCSRLHGN